MLLVCGGIMLGVASCVMGMFVVSRLGLGTRPPGSGLAFVAFTPRYGRFGNQLLSLQRAYSLSRETNATLLYPPFFQDGVDYSFGAVLNEQTFSTLPGVAPLVPWNEWCYRPGVECVCVNHSFSTPALLAEFRRYGLLCHQVVSAGESVDLAQFLRSHRAPSGTTVFWLGQVFYYTRSAGRYSREFWAHIEPAPALVAEAAKFRRETILHEHYDALHLRMFEAADGCSRRTSSLDRLLCDPTLEYVQSLRSLKCSGGHAAWPLFVASDRQNPRRDEVFRRSNFTVFYDHGRYASDTLPGAIVELWTLAGANALLGVRASSFVGAAESIRLAQGKSGVIRKPC